ncbi:response regulator transcription factor [Kitasatospora albolonga]|uniref:response regulator transcription factor n=1 Tax=Kitasatospora albolonga TaxID=68173 RepID=UPI0031ECCF45
MTSVLVVDDQYLVRAGVAALLRAAPGFGPVWEAGDGEGALAAAALHRPEVVLMDIRMPGMNGITATERLLAGVAGEAPAERPCVIMLTTFDLDEYVYAALRAGASGFLLKDTPPERLLAAIATIAAGDVLFASGVTRRLVEAFAPRAEPAGARPELEQLTGREREVLTWVARGLSNEEIAARLVVSEATVKTHLHRVMTKLGLRSRAQAVIAAYEARLVVPGALAG